MNNIKIIAHRGIHNNKDIPENSLKAFTKCLEKNIPIELDIQLTKDKIPVICHDFNLKRMTKKDVLLKDLTLKQIKELKLLNTNETIPTLKEVLDLVNNKVLLDIEIKNNKKVNLVVKKTKDLLDNYKGPYTIKSFNPRIVKIYKKYNKNINCGLLITNSYPKKILNNLMKSNVILKYTHPDFLAIEKHLVKEKKLLNYTNNIFIWTITSKDELKDYSKDYTFICNNLPY